MKKIYFVLMMVFLVNGVWGQVLTENFSYTTGSLLTANGWTNFSGTNNFIAVSSPGLSYTGSPSSGVGNCASMTTSGEDVSRSFAAITSGSIYTSCLVNVSAAQATGDYCIGLMTGTTAFPLRIYIKSVTGGFVFGCSKLNATVVYESTVRTFNTTYLLVANYIYNTGNATDDIVNVWVNPALGGTEGAPTFSAGATQADGAASGIIGFYLRQGTAGSASTQRVDAVRVGTTWSSVTPIVVAPTTQALSISFSNVQTTQFDINWTDGNGTNRAVFVAQTNTGTAAPTDYSAYAANNTFMSGDQIGSTGWYCVYNGSAAHPTPTTITNLSANTTYRVMVCEYNGNAGSETYNISTATDNPLNQTTQAGGALTPPTLTAAVGATVDADFDITYADDAAWRSAVTVVKYGAATLTAGTDYDLAPGILTLKPTGGNAALHVAGTQVVSVTATGYNDATVSQAIDAGAATQLGITTQPVAPATNGGVLVTQPVIAVQDQYGNTVTTSTAAITANVGAGTWSIGGTVLQNAAAGTGLATFTDLTATSAAAEAATIDFTSPGLTHIESSIFNIPAPPTLYTYIGTGTSSWANSANWSPTGVPTNQDEVLFNGATPVTITNVPSAALRTFTVTGSGAVTLQAAGAVTLNIGGGTTPQFSMASGSSLILDGNAAISVNIITGNTASVTGAITAQGGAHRLTAVDASGITFHNGAMFTAGTSFAGNPFGPSGATSNSVIFESGATFIQKSGSNPFASTAPASIVVFQTGSLFKLQANLTPSLSGRTYANFEVDFASAVINGSGTAILNVDNLTVTQGSTSLGMTGGFNIKGDISVATGATLNLAPATAGTVTFAGASAQSINNSGTLTFGTNQSIVLNNANGLTLNTDVALGSAATLTLTNGSITLGNQTLTANSVTGASATNYIRTTGTGSLALRNITTTTTFPVGNGVSYTPAIITNTGTADDFAVNVATGTPCNADPNQSVNRVWTITEAVAGGSIADVTMQWNLAEENPTFTRLACAAVHCAGGVIDITGTNSTAGGGDPYTQTITGVSSFSPFGVTSDPVALPITIAYFRGGRQGNTNSLTWKVNCATSSRVTMTVERSGDGRTYAPINTITADGVRCLDAFVYNDIDPLPGLNYYKLKSVDIDGKITYSSIVTLLNKEKGFEIVNVTPNPGYGQFKLNVTITEKTTMEIVITDMQGRVVSKTAVSLTSGFNAIDLDAAKLPAGMYRVYGNTAAGNTKALSFVKQ